MNSSIPVSRQRRRREKGSSMVELALCFLGFMLLTVGSMEFGLAVYAYNSCSYLARDASRWASVRGSQSQTATTCDSTKGVADGCPANATDVQNYVLSQAVGLDNSKFTWTSNSIAWTPNNNPGAEVSVTVAYTVVPLAGLALQQNLNVSSTSQMEIVH